MAGFAVGAKDILVAALLLCGADHRFLWSASALSSQENKIPKLVVPNFLSFSLTNTGRLVAVVRVFKDLEVQVGVEPT